MVIKGNLITVHLLWSVFSSIAILNATLASVDRGVKRSFILSNRRAKAFRKMSLHWWKISTNCGLKFCGYLPDMLQVLSRHAAGTLQLLCERLLKRCVVAWNLWGPITKVHARVNINIYRLDPKSSAGTPQSSCGIFQAHWKQLFKRCVGAVKALLVPSRSVAGTTRPDAGVGKLMSGLKNSLRIIIMG